MPSFEDIRGIVPVVIRNTLDTGTILSVDDTELTVACYEKRFKPFVIGLIDVLRQSDILTDFNDIVEWQYAIEKLQTDLARECMLSIGDIREGNRLAMMDIAGQILGGDGASSVTVSIDEEGNITIAPDGQQNSIPTGDSDIDFLRSRMGSMEYVESQIEEYIIDFDDFWGIAPTGDVDRMTLFLTNKYLLNANIATAITDYNTWRTNVSLNTPPNPSMDGVDREFNCRGLNKQTLNSWYIDNGVADVELILSLLGALTDDQLELWFSQSGDTISSDYTNTPCYRYPAQQITISADDYTGQLFTTLARFSINTELVLNRRYIVTASGVITDGSTTWDGFFVDDGANVLNGRLQLWAGNQTGASVVGDVETSNDNTNSYTNDVTQRSFATCENLNLSTGTWSGAIVFNFEDKGAL